MHGLRASEYKVAYVTAKQILLKESAIKRLVEPAEVASLVGWLASEQAGAVTGASHTMDGGWSAR